MDTPKMPQQNILPEELSVALCTRELVTLVLRTMRGGMASEMAGPGKLQATSRAFVSPVHLHGSTSQYVEYSSNYTVIPEQVLDSHSKENQEVE